MARIPEDQLEWIKSDISLVRLVESQGHTPTKQGKDFVVSCPFHEESTASCVISPKSNLFNCFGCGTGGSVVDWVMKTEGVSFRHAVELLRNEFLPLAAENSEVPKVVKQNTKQKLPTPLAANTDNQTALRDVIGFYHDTLKQSPEAQAYLRSRGLENSELIERFKLGFANRTLGYHLPAKNRKAGAELRGKLQEVGVLRESGHEHFNGSLVVPIIDESGAITEVYGRKIQGNKLRKGTAQHLYLPGPHEGVWNASAMKDSPELILCESLIDAMTFWCAGFRNVTASYGTSGFTAAHLAAFKQHSIQRVLIAYDRDEAGNTAAEALAKQLMAEGIDCYRITFPKGMDANEYAMQVTPPVKSLGLVIRKAEWLGRGKPPERQLDLGIQALAPSVPVESQKRINPEAESSETKKPKAPASTLPESTQASPLPELPAVELGVEVAEHEIKITVEKRLYRVRGLQKNMSYEQLKINLLVSQGDAVHVDQLELYNAKARQNFIKQASIELGVKDELIKQDLGKVLLKLEALQDEQIQQALAAKTEKPQALSNDEQQAALNLLQDPSLLSRLLLDFESCGVVGEESNKLVAYLACVSRKMSKPLAVIIQSSSAAGKSSLMDAVLNWMPEEDRHQYSAMTGQSLFYMGETNLKHKILAIAEEEGASNASYALKLLQSEGEVSIASTSKNETTGNLETKSYTVQGPVMLFLTTTAIDIDEELLNRCLVLTVNESREQTEAIHALQRQSQTLEGLLRTESKRQLVELHRNAQRLLRTLNVVNPYAEQLTFLSDKTRTRRDHMKYLQLINSITLLHQYQREIKTVVHQGETVEYIEVSLEDIAQANRLAHEVLGRSLDELPPQTRKLLQLVHRMVAEGCQQERIEQKDYHFSRKAIRDYSGWSDNQLKVHCARLEEFEYLLVHRGGRGSHIVYELLFNGEGVDHRKQVMGLLDTQSLKNHEAVPAHPRAHGTSASCTSYDEQRLGHVNQKLVSSCPEVGGRLGQSCTAKNAGNPSNTGSIDTQAKETEENSNKGKNNNASHRNPNENHHTSLAAMSTN